MALSSLRWSVRLQPPAADSTAKTSRSLRGELPRPGKANRGSRWRSRPRGRRRSPRQTGSSREGRPRCRSGSLQSCLAISSGVRTVSQTRSSDMMPAQRRWGQRRIPQRDMPTSNAPGHQRSPDFRRRRGEPSVHVELDAACRRHRAPTRGDVVARPQCCRRCGRSTNSKSTPALGPRPDCAASSRLRPIPGGPSAERTVVESGSSERYQNSSVRSVWPSSSIPRQEAALAPSNSSSPSLSQPGEVDTETTSRAGRSARPRSRGRETARRAAGRLRWRPAGRRSGRRPRCRPRRPRAGARRRRC